MEKLQNCNEFFFACFMIRFVLKCFHDIRVSLGGGQLRSAILVWSRQTFRASVMTSGTSLSSFSAPMTTTGSTKDVSFPMWRMTRTLSLVRLTSTKLLRKVLSFWIFLSCLFFVGRLIYLKAYHFFKSREVVFVF